MVQDRAQDTYVDPFVAEAQRQRREPHTGSESQEDGPQSATARLACGKKGCYLPWDEHLTKGGNVKAAYRDHQAAGVGTTSRAVARELVRGLSRKRGFLPSRAASRRKAPGSFGTHIVVQQNGQNVRMTLQEFADLMDQARAEAEQSR